MRSWLRLFTALTALALILSCGVSQQPSVAPAPAGQKVKATDSGSCDNLVPPPESQFPASFDYPQSANTVGSWVSSRSGDRMRRHAYCVFAGLNQPAQSSWPVWRTWGTSTQAFPLQYNPWRASAADGSLLASQTNSTAPLNQMRSHATGQTGPGGITNNGPAYPIPSQVASNYPQCVLQNGTLRDGEVFQNNGDIMVAAVSYNRAALQNILGTGLYNAAALDSGLPPQSSSPSNGIPLFPSSSIVLKVMLWPVSGGGSTWSAVTALPVWNWDANKPGGPSDGQYAGYEMQNFWTNAVAISSAPVSGPGRIQRVQFLYNVFQYDGKTPLGPNTYDAPVVGLDRFYSRKYSAADLAALSPCDRAILDASAYWTYKSAFQAGDSLALIAMHIMTKEQSDWTFQSAWWHPDARDCVANNRFCSGRPASVPGGDTTWKNYMMTTTYGMLQQPGNSNYYAPPNTKSPPQVWPVAYNPYIELAATHPITTNCMNCHHRAAWPPDNPQQKPDRGRSSAYLQSSPASPNPNPLESFQTNNGIFNGLLTVDAMWAVSDRAGYSVPKAAEKRP